MSHNCFNSLDLLGPNILNVLRSFTKQAVT